MNIDLKTILKDASLKIDSVKKDKDLEEVKSFYLGKKGQISLLLRELKNVKQDERAKLGKEINELKEKVLHSLDKKSREFQEDKLKEKFFSERIDVTEPGLKKTVGKIHPITKTITEISEIFMSMGYSIVEGPEIETVENNFDSLNASKNHPSRDMTDTFYITENTLLRTQTSPVQIRTLKSKTPPIKVIAPGRCFRADTLDATHTPMFHQVEGLLVDEKITLADLKGTLDVFAKKMFETNVHTRFRPHYFPFTEPSSEMDMACFLCKGKGCSVCKGSGWIEILGCGMVHPNVLEVGNVDTDKYMGFAFGMGVERIAMLKYGIEDIRLFYENDIRFIGEFS
ncbi:MAG: phenylalanine--tRNA ligase subunit alpha [Clostridiales Family XIII bacterium]|jgi:phenylalanyl-tRNA synthetase alpha chain|nr:phenylalanine--tRNA ligase subunit alpha [Clostridiales Family XIII bacterium]